MAARKTTLMDATESLIHNLVRDARKPRQLGMTADGAPNMVMPDLADQVKVATAALNFLQVKHRIAPEEEPSEFERELAAFHNGAPEGDGPAGPQAHNGSAVHSGD